MCCSSAKVDAGEMCSRVIDTLDPFSEECSAGDQLSRLLASMVIILFPSKTWFNADCDGDTGIGCDV